MIVNYVVIYFRPTSPHLPGSLLSPNAHIFIRFPVMYLYPYYLISCMYLNCLLWVVVIFLYGAYIVPFVLLEFRLGRKSYFAIDELRKPPMLLSAYRTIQVLQTIGLNPLGPCIIPTQAYFGQVIVFCAYMVFKHHDNMKRSLVIMMIAWACISAVFWSTVLLMGGYLHLYGKKVLESWKYHEWSSRTEGKLVTKFQKSCSPIMINHGKAYIIRRITVLKFIRGFTRGVFRTLLTLN